VSQINDTFGIEAFGAFKSCEAVHSDLDELHTDVSGFEEVEIGLNLILGIEHGCS